MKLFGRKFFSSVIGVDTVLLLLNVCELSITVAENAGVLQKRIGVFLVVARSIKMFSQLVLLCIDKPYFLRSLLATLDGQADRQETSCLKFVALCRNSRYRCYICHWLLCY